MPYNRRIVYHSWFQIRLHHVERCARQRFLKFIATGGTGSPQVKYCQFENQISKVEIAANLFFNPGKKLLIHGYFLLFKYHRRT
jgi:hypothetical protein